MRHNLINSVTRTNPKVAPQETTNRICTISFESERKRQTVGSKTQGRTQAKFRIMSSGEF